MNFVLGALAQKLVMSCVYRTRSKLYLVWQLRLFLTWLSPLMSPPNTITSTPSTPNQNGLYVMLQQLPDVN